MRLQYAVTIIRSYRYALDLKEIGLKLNFSTKSSTSISFVCQSCGNDTTKWTGKCSSCNEFNTMKEFKTSSITSANRSRNISPNDINRGAWLKSNGSNETRSSSKLLSLLTSSNVQSEGSTSSTTTRRLSFGSTELDRLFGGGLLYGSTTLIAGSPGVGKSTLLLQIAALLCRGHVLNKVTPKVNYASFFCNSTTLSKSVIESSSVVYVSGEEAVSQLRDRAYRLKIDAPGLLVLNESRVEGILAELDMLTSPPSAVIVDSAQTLFTDSSTSAAGSVSQVKESALRLIQWAKATNVPVMISGHVTKSGDVAGPRTLEHMVDTVLFMEAEEAVSGGLLGSGGSDSVSSSSLSSAFFHSHRLIRCIKNRFGSSNEIGLFEMTEQGFIESSASSLFLSNSLPGSDQTQKRPNGCAVAVTTEGSRAICVEVQALSVQQAGPYPRHRSAGISSERLYTIAVVLAKHAKIRTNVDLLASVVGGLKIAGDPAADLAIAAAIISTISNRPSPSYSCFLGEIGLGGEIRAVARLGDRLKAASQLGFSTVYIPASVNIVSSEFGLRIVKLRNVKELASLFSNQIVLEEDDDDSYNKYQEKDNHTMTNNTMITPVSSININPRHSSLLEEDKDDSSILSPIDLMEKAEALAVRMHGLNVSQTSSSLSPDIRDQRSDSSSEKTFRLNWEESMKEFESTRGPAGLDSSEDPIER